MASRNHVGISLVEILVALVVLFVVVFVVAPFLLFSTMGKNGPSGQMVQTLSNMKQLYLATRQMELDRGKSGNTNIGWPGDTGGTFSNWTVQMVKGQYMTTNDLCKLLSAPGVVVPPREIPLTNNTALLVYAVSANSPDTAIFLTSANFTSTPTGGVLNLKAKPFGEKGFVVFYKGGNGDVAYARGRAGYQDPLDVTVFRSSANDWDGMGQYAEDTVPKPYVKKGPFVFRKEGNATLLKGDSTNKLGSYVPLCR